MIIPTMGTHSESLSAPVAHSALADVLFTPVQQSVLGLLFGQPDRRFQSAELIRLAAAGTGAVHRVLKRLESTGLVTVDAVGNQKFYQANPESPIHAELCGLVQKTVGLAQPLQAALEPLRHRITAAFIFGSIAKGSDRSGSDIDLMVISDDLGYGELYSALAPVESRLARSISPNVMDLGEWKQKREARDGFVARIAEQPRLFVIGSDDGLE
jgi:predicted nucleotidyltransferase